MRRLLIKLVAIETMLVGWLSYWIFLIYANNPAVSAGLGDQLARFPQLAFTTVDLAVLVIIAAFAITLAFKFHRGLRPGIRLERALQMLENLMKRNLILEAQVAELRVEKVEKIPAKPMPPLASKIPLPGLRGPGFAPMSTPMGPEPLQGSWEKAFRTPLEAGPSPAKVSSSIVSEASFQRDTAVPPPRIEEAAPIMSPSKIVIPDKPLTSTGLQVEDKPPEKTVIPPSLSPTTSAGWEDSPKYVGESTGILTPSSSSKKGSQSSVDMGLKQPYIPVQAPRMPPSSVIVGPMNQKPASPGGKAPRPIVRPSFPKPSIKEQPPIADIPEPKPANAPIIIDEAKPSTENPKLPEATIPIPLPAEETKEKAVDKSGDGYKKKRLHDEDLA